MILLILNQIVFRQTNFDVVCGNENVFVCRCIGHMILLCYCSVHADVLKSISYNYRLVYDRPRCAYKDDNEDVTRFGV